MTTITIPTDQTSEETSALTLPEYPTAYATPAPRRSAPLFVPRDQAYYWTMSWQRDEAEALHEIAEGKARRFTSGSAAAEWLLSDDE